MSSWKDIRPPEPLETAVRVLDPRMAIGLLITVFLLLLASVFIVVKDTRDAVNDSTYDRGGLSGVQLQASYERLVSGLHAFEVAPSGATAEEALLHFDIVYERVSSQPTRPPINDFNDPAYAEMLRGLLVALNKETAAIDAAADGDWTGLDGMADRLLTLRPDIGRIASRSIQLAADLRQGLREANTGRVQVVIWLVFGLAVLGVLFLTMILAQTRRAERQHRELLELAAELKEASVNAEQANRAKSRFLAHMSHDLRTPLNSVLGFSELIREGVMGKCSPPIYIDYAASIHESSRHLLALIDGLLDLSKIEAEELELNEVTISVNDAVINSARMIRQAADDKAIVVDVRLLKPDLAIKADPVRVRQAIVNVIDNAVKFSPSGSQIDVTVARLSGGDITVVVQDRGRGIPEEELAAVMQPFRRGNPQAYEETDGVGLGLSIVRSLIELHGGSVTLESSVGVGTTVTLQFPASRVLSRRRVSAG